MKRIFALLLTIVMIFSLVACGNSSPAAQGNSNSSAQPSGSSSNVAAKPLAGKSVAICTATATHGFNSELIVHSQNTVKRLADEYGFDYKLVTCEDSTAQVNALETLLSEKHDLIVVSAVIGEDIRAVCNDIIASGTKLFIFSRAIGDIDCPEYLGDQYGMGETQANYIIDFFKDDLAANKKVEVLEFYGDDSVNSQERSRGLHETLKAGGINVNQQFRADWNRQKAMEQMENWLTSSVNKDISSIRAIVTQDDEISYGIMDAIEQYSGSVDISNIDLFVSIGSQKAWLDKFDEYKDKYGMSLAGLDYSPTYSIDAVTLAVQWLAGEKELQSGRITFVPTIVDASRKAEYMESEVFKTRYAIFDDKGNLITNN